MVDASQYALSIRDVSKRFGSTQALSRVSFDVTMGDCFGLIGPNGAGKTTAFSIIAGYLRPDSGQALVLDHDARATDVLATKRSVLPQDAMLPPYESVGEFLVHLARLGGAAPDQATQQAQAALKEVNGADWWHRRCGKLSHGMAKRVGIAQALLGNPQIVLLDEPTAGLDPRIAFEIRQLIKQRKGQCTLLISSHNLYELEEICDAAAILDRGQVVAAGSIAELTSSQEQFRVHVVQGPVQIDALARIPGVSRATFDDTSRAVTVYCERYEGQVEDLINAVLMQLIQDGKKISAVTRGQGLEKRVMELTT